MEFARRLARPRSWPVRWRLATVSAGLTFVILVLFGGAIGQIATQRIRDDFNKEVQSAVQILSSETRIVYPPFGEPEARRGYSLDAFTLPDDATAKVFDVRQHLIAASTDPEELGPLRRGLHDYNGMRVATEAVSTDEGVITGFIQYGRSLQHVDATVDRVWLLIAAGIFGGTLLAIVRAVAVSEAIGLIARPAIATPAKIASRVPPKMPAAISSQTRSTVASTCCRLRPY